MHDHECVDEPVAVIVVRSEINLRVGSLGGIFRHGLCVRLHVAGAAGAIGIVADGMRQGDGSDDVAHDVDQSLSDFAIELGNAAGGNFAGRKEQVIKVLVGGSHLSVGEVNQDDGDAKLSAQGNALQGGRARQQPRLAAGDV